MNYYDAKREIQLASSHIGREITRAQAVSVLNGDARKAALHNNPLNDWAQFRQIGEYIVEVALVDFTGMRGGGYSVGVTVFGHHDLSELVALDALTGKLKSLEA